MEGSCSLVSRARTAFHSAAAKAERALIDFKSDLTPADHPDTDKQWPDCSVDEWRDESLHQERELKGSNELKQSRWRPPNIGTKQDWQERLKTLGIGRRSTEDIDKLECPNMSFPVFDENVYLYNEKVAAEAKGLDLTPTAESSDVATKDVIPPVSVLKQLCVAIEAGKNYRSIKDMLACSRTSSPVRERASLSLSAVKSLVLREREKLASEFGDDEVLSFIQSILDAEGLSPSRKIGSYERRPTTLTMPRDIHAAPPESFLVLFAEVIGSLKTLQKMALLWCRLVAELRRFWLEEQYVPGIPIDRIPDLNSCLLYQQMQVINCCVSRKNRRAIFTETLESLIRVADGSASDMDIIPPNAILYARIAPGELVVRLGANHLADNLTMLETGEPIFAPVTQEGPLLTEDLIRENEEFVLRTGSVGAGCSHLLSDMQAFKAANPGCILEDFVRWHSPPDWTEADSGNETDATTPSGADPGSARGRLSGRMQKEGNLWRELWETSKPVPAVRQAPLFDEDLAVEGILTAFEIMPPSQLFEQLFLSLLSLGFVIAEPILTKDDNMSKLFYDCKDYVVITCQGEAWSEKVDDICQVYETVEAMVVRPEEVMKMMKQPEEITSNDEPKRRFKRLSLIFGGKGRSFRLSKEPKELRSPDSARQAFSNFFDSKSSLFSKKPPKPDVNAEKPLSPDLNGWTVI